MLKSLYLVNPLLALPGTKTVYIFYAMFEYSRVHLMAFSMKLTIISCLLQRKYYPPSIIGHAALYPIIAFVQDFTLSEPDVNLPPVTLVVTLYADVVRLRKPRMVYRWMSRKVVVQIAVPVILFDKPAECCARRSFGFVTGHEYVDIDIGPEQDAIIVATGIVNLTNRREDTLHL